MEPTAQSFSAVLERILYYDEANGYCVAEVRTAEEAQAITIQGKLPGVQCGETLALKGSWTQHKKHGDQFKVSQFKSQLPASIHGIRNYLGSGLIPGIGPSYAKKIVDHFGTQTLDIIRQDSGRLGEVPGIGKNRAHSIKQAWEAQTAVRDVMIFLQTYGISPAQCLKLVNKYGTETKRIIQDQPYKIVGEIERIGFKAADKIALNLGFPSNSEARLQAGILHALTQLQSSGHTLGIESQLAAEAQTLLAVDAAMIQQALAQLQRQQILRAVQLQDPLSGCHERAYQLPIMAAAERQIAESIQALAQAPSALPPLQIEAAVDWAQKRAGFVFAAQQTAALKGALTSKISIITGGPGTGKTTLLRALVDILSAKKVKLCLASPTGRAAQRLADAAGTHASTIHRLLKYEGQSRKFVHNKHQPLHCELLILDEASMLDTQLAAQLLQAIPQTAHLVLVGDADQLPSVGAGNVLADLIQSAPAHLTRLDTIFRQGKQSEIVTTAHAILRGEQRPSRIYNSLRMLQKEDDLNFIQAESPEQSFQAIRYLVKEVIPKQQGFDPIRELQVMAPMHRGSAGIQALNGELQAVLNPIEKARARQRSTPDYRPSQQIHFKEQTQKQLPVELSYGSTVFRIGDKVIQMRNNYDKNIFNGDTGIISSIAADSSTLSIQFGQESIEYAKSELSDLQLAYCISIHKSQGSEYPVVIIPILKQHFLLLQRNLVYTGITRARKKVYLVGCLDAYAMAVKNNKQQVRQTYLCHQLKKLAGKTAG